MSNKVANYIKEVRAELKKVSWPTKNEMVNSTIVVIISVSILAVLIGVWDLFLSRLA